MPKIELHIVIDAEQIDWASMGLKKPKNSDTIVRRRLVSSEDIIDIEEVSKSETLVRLSYLEEPVLTKNNYDVLAIALNDMEYEAEEEDLEL